MGKLQTYVSILIFVDLMLIITGQLTGTLTSAIFEVLLDVSLLRSTAFWSGLIQGASGIATLFTVSAVTVGFIITKSDTLLYVGMGVFFANLSVDFIVIYNYLRIFNPVLATMVMGPLIIMYAITTVEWLRGKD